MPVYSDLPPTREELQQLRGVDMERKRGTLMGSEPPSSFLDRPAAAQMDFGEKSDYAHDLNVIRHVNEFVNNPEYATAWYRRVRKPQKLPVAMGALYGGAAGGLGGYAVTGSPISGALAGLLGAGAGAAVGAGREVANRKIMQGAFAGTVPEAGEVPQRTQEYARKYNRITGMAAPAAVGLAAIAALVRYAAKSAGQTEN